MMFVRNLPKEEKYKLYKRIKGWCLWEHCRLTTAMHAILNEKAKDVQAILDEEAIDYLEVYKDYSYGRC